MSALLLAALMALLAGTGIDASTAAQSFFPSFGDDEEKATKVLDALASADGPGIQARIRLMFAFGQGVRQDYVRAHIWFQLGAESGDAQAAIFRDIIAAKMSPQQTAEARTLARACQGRQQGRCG